MISIATLRSKVRQGTGQDEDDLPDADVDLQLNITYWEILEKFHVRETESSTTFPTVVGQREYLLPPSFESLRISAIKDNDTEEHSELTRISIKDYESIYSEDTDQQAKPSKYYRANKSIILWPTPDDIYTIVLHYRSQLDDLSDDNQYPELPKSWQEMLIVGARYRCFHDNNDYIKGNAAKAVYTQLINSAVPVEAKEEWDSSKAGVQILGREY